MGVPRNRARNSGSLSEASFSRGGANSRGSKAGSAVMGARRFQGQTSWQMSQPKTCGPMAARCSKGMAARSSMVKYEMQRGESMPEGRIAAVEEALQVAKSMREGRKAGGGGVSMRGWQVRQGAGGGESGAMLSETRSS